MAREIELKLELPASAADKVMRLPWLWEQAVGEIKPTTMVTKYYDTPKNDLRRSGISLRVRRIGKKHVQTVKSSPPKGAKPLLRAEWERETASEEPQLTGITGTPLDRMSKRRLKKKLGPVFVVNVERSAYPIESANSAIEVAIDRGSIIAGNGAQPFCEIELELKRGSSSELARIGRRLASEAPVSLGLKSKADRGFDLRRGGGEAVHYGAPIAIDKSMTVGETFQAIAWGSLRHFSLNADAVRAGDAEAVHQMRVGIRRLRAVISTFRDLVDGPETDRIKAELAWITGELGSLRDLDVFIAQVKSRSPADPAATGLASHLAELRKRALTDAARALESDRYRQLVLKAALWILAAEWSDSGLDPRVQPHAGIRTFAKRRLKSLQRNLARKLDKIAASDAETRHKIRIEVKRLRYASEALAPLFPTCSKRMKRLGATLRRLQDVLGDMQDTATQERLGQEIASAASDIDPAVLYAMGEHVGLARSRRDAREKETRRLAQRFVQMKSLRRT